MPQHPDPAPGSASATNAPPATTVREILEEARRVAGSGPRLAARLEELGVGPPDTNRYSESAISNWIRGRTMPPADVLVAATIIAGQPLAGPLSLAESTDALRVLEQGAAKLQYEIDALRAAVIDLYGRLGYPMPNLDVAPDAGATPDRAASAG
jgi:transcriptional regulator with XRE-family HTH domain